MKARAHDERGRRRFAVMLLFLGSCLVAALLFELGVRWLEPQPEEPYRYSRDTYYEPVPGADFIYARSEFRVPVRFNRFGMRDRERTLQKPAGVQRIALLGDSFVEAMQVPQDSMLSQRLERELQDCVRGHETEVLNFGVSGFGTAATAARYARLARRFEPDVVLVLFVHNDLWDLVLQDSRLYTIRGERLVLQPLQPGWVSRGLRPLLDFGKHHFHAQRFLKYRLLRWRQGALHADVAREAQAHGGEPKPGDEAWERLRQALTLLREMAAEDGAVLAVAQATTTGPAMDGQLAGLCAELGLPFANLGRVLSEAPVPVFFRIDGHWMSQGHAVACQALAPWLCALLHGRGSAQPEGTSQGTREGQSDL